MAKLGSSHIDPDIAKNYQEAGIKDIDDMIALKQYRVDPPHTIGYRKQGISEVRVMSALGSVGIYPSWERITDGVASGGVGNYREAGIESPQDMITLKAHDIGGKNALIFAEAGFEDNPHAMIELNLIISFYGDKKIEGVLDLARAGFRGNQDAMSQLYSNGGLYGGVKPLDAVRFSEAGFHNNADAMIELTGKRVESLNAVGYAELGFRSNKDAMIKLTEKGISPQYIQAQLLLMDGAKPATPEGLLKSILGLYHAPKEATPK